MSVGTATAIALAASAASSAYAAHAQASSAKKAAATQSASADKAMLLQKEMADRALQAQNQAMYGNQGGGGGGMGGPGGGGGYGGGIDSGIRGIYSPYVNSAPATLSALHEYLGIPGAAQSQSAVPLGTYGRPMSPQFGGGPMSPGSPAMSMAGLYRPPGQMPGGPMPSPSAPMAPTGPPFRPRVGSGQQPNQIPMSALYQRRG